MGSVVLTGQTNGTIQQRLVITPADAGYIVRSENLGMGSEPCHQPAKLITSNSNSFVGAGSWYVGDGGVHCAGYDVTYTIDGDALNVRGSLFSDNGDLAWKLTGTYGKVPVEKNPASGKDAIQSSSADNPVRLQPRVPAKVTLDQNDSAYFSVALPAEEIRVVLDTRTADDKAHNLQSGLSVLDRDGGVLQKNAIAFNEIDVSWRRVAYFTLKKPATMGFKVSNFDSSEEIVGRLGLGQLAK